MVCLWKSHNLDSLQHLKLRQRALDNYMRVTVNKGIDKCKFSLSQAMKVRKRAKIGNRYNQAPHLTQDTIGKVTTLQLDITNESQEVSPFPAGDHKASKTDVHESITKQDRNNINDPQKKHHSR